MSLSRRLARRVRRHLQGTGATEVPAPPPVASPAPPPPEPASPPYVEPSSASVFRADMLIADALAVHPGVAEVLARHGAGGCPSCALRHSEGLEEGLANYGIEVSEVLAALEQL